jgi:hypothetical protein
MKTYYFPLDRFCNTFEEAQRILSIVNEELKQNDIILSFEDKCNSYEGIVRSEKIRKLITFAWLNAVGKK